MEIYQLIHFIAIIETGSFTKGADRAAVSQSAISASIARLEAEFDVQLLDRRRSPVVPTAAGERLLEAGKAILQICNTVKGELELDRQAKGFENRHTAILLQSPRFQPAGFLPAQQSSCSDPGVRWVLRAIGRIARRTAVRCCPNYHR